ncbi:branched-chain amino acid transport system permease protein (plasmid) [Azospirillum sp. B510]|uniref:branched-chain amino acid ABC transporter permease n=1 Tax=Azospirillum sp. (strain B510) TaxID=137722 RepID=UPI0001C4C9C5|nr:branched-chain amino acid ABC transporter permease [Azospirillum sp. B510]BAI75224.1 branched-chain amino acid transport system permease protein [Azospirillum sp. B510]
MTDLALEKTPAAAPRRVSPALPGIALLLIVAYGVLPLVGSEYLFDAILTPFLALALAGLGLNILTGYAGQVSLGSSAFMAVGAYAAYNLALRLPGVPFLLDILLAGLIAAAVGLLFGLPSLRLRGFYLAVSTLAAQFFVQWIFNKVGWFSNDSPSGIVTVPPLSVAGFTLDSSAGRYLFALGVVTAVTLAVWRLVESPTGRALVALRDHETAARVIGIPVLRVKLLAFAVSSFIIGVAGVLWAFAYLRTVEPAGFNLDRSFQILFIVIIGGLASLRGAFLGAALIVVFPLLLARLGEALLGGLFDSGVLEMSQRIVLGLLIVTFLIAEPAGLTALLDRTWSRITRRVQPPG